MTKPAINVNIFNPVADGRPLIEAGTASLDVPITHAGVELGLVTVEYDVFLRVKLQDEKTEPSVEGIELATAYINVTTSLDETRADIRDLARTVRTPTLIY